MGDPLGALRSTLLRGSRLHLSIELTATLEIIRRWLMIILIVGLAGTVVELLLLKHTDGIWQLAPVLLMVAAMAVVGWNAVTRSPASRRALQAAMSLLVLCGAVGMIQHYRGNIAYERDSNPSLSGAELYRSAFLGSTPALAPGAMIPLGLIGLLFAFRHPGGPRSKRGEHPSESRNEP